MYTTEVAIPHNETDRDRVATPSLYAVYWLTEKDRYGKETLQSCCQELAAQDLFRRSSTITRKIFHLPSAKTQRKTKQKTNTKTINPQESSTIVHTSWCYNTPYTVNDRDAHFSTRWVVAISRGVVAAVLAGVGVLLLSEKLDRPQH